MDVKLLYWCAALCLLQLVSGDGDKMSATCVMKENTNPDLAEDLKQPITGTVTLTQDDDDDPTTVKIELSGFNTTDGENEHGFHIHESADPDNNCNNNGGHYNPESKDHGGPDANIRHNGDLGNVVEDGQGRVSTTKTDSYVKLSGDHSSVGRSIVVHALKDDLGLVPNNPESLKTGNAGARIACCKIELDTSDAANSIKVSTIIMMFSLLLVYLQYRR